MKVLSFLADQAQIDPQQKVHALGINWTYTHTPAPPMAVVVFVELTSEETPTALSVKFDLVDSDGNLVALPPPAGGEPEPFTTLAVGTAGPSAPGESAPTRVPFVVQIGGGLPIAPGAYRFAITVNRAGGETITDQVRFSIKRPGEI